MGSMVTPEEENPVPRLQILLGRVSSDHRKLAEKEYSRIRAGGGSDAAAATHVLALLTDAEKAEPPERG